MHNSWHLTSSAFIWSILLHYSHQHYFQFLLHEFHYIHYIFLSQSQPTARRKFESHLLSLYHFFSIWITLAGLFVHCTVMSHAKKRQHNKRLDAAAHRQQQTAISGNNTINHWLRVFYHTLIRMRHYTKMMTSFLSLFKIHAAFECHQKIFVVCHLFIVHIYLEVLRLIALCLCVRSLAALTLTHKSNQVQFRQNEINSPILW